MALAWPHSSTEQCTPARKRAYFGSTYKLIRLEGPVPHILLRRLEPQRAERRLRVGDAQVLGHMGQVAGGVAGDGAAGGLDGLADGPGARVAEGEAGIEAAEEEEEGVEGGLRERWRWRCREGGGQELHDADGGGEGEGESGGDEECR